MILFALAAVAVAVQPAPAQTSADPAAPAPPPVTSTAPAFRKIVLPPNTEVTVTPNDLITTKGKALKEGSKFRISTMYDVMQDGYVTIPKGTAGEGTVTWMTNKGAFGKSGKMEVSFDWLDLGGKRIPLTGTHRQEGEGNTGATVGTAVAVGVFSAFVTGRSAKLVNGQQLRARTVEPLAFEVPENAPRLVTGTLTSTPAAVPVPSPPPTVPIAAPAAVAPAAAATAPAAKPGN